MRLLCGCATHTYGLDISRPDLTFKAECLKAQAEVEHKAAAYDALFETAYNAVFRAHPGDATKLTDLLLAAERVPKTQSGTLPSTGSGTVSESRTVSEVEGKEP